MRAYLFMLLNFGVLPCFAQQNCLIVPHPDAHKLKNNDCWGRVDWMTKHEHENAAEMCGFYNGYVTVFEDNFNGTEIDRKKWRATADERWFGNGKEDMQLFTAFDNTSADNYEVSGGALKIKVKPPLINSVFIYDTFNNATCNSAQAKRDHKYTSGQIKSYKLFPHGVLEVRCKIPYKGRHFNFAPLWLLHPGGEGTDSVSGQNKVKYYEEIDIEFWDHKWWHTKYNTPSWTYIHKPPPANLSESNCGDGNNNHCIAVSLYDKWITMRIYWDEWRIRWTVDGRTFRTVYRTYSLSGLPISECTGPANAGYKRRNDMFPSFGNMFLLSCIGANPDHLDGDEIMEIDYIKVMKKINCHSFLHINEYKPHARRYDYYPPTKENTTPQVLTSGIITVAGNGENVRVQRNNTMFWTPARLDLYASTSITLIPGFSVDPAANLDMLWACPLDDVGKNGLVNSVLYGDGFYAEAVACPVFPGKDVLDIEEDSIVGVDDNDPTEYTQNSNASGFHEEEDGILSIPFIEVNPNPVGSGYQFTIYYSVPGTTHAEICIYDSYGGIVSCSKQGVVDRGVFTVVLRDLSLRSGVYNAVLLTGSGNAQTHFIVIK